VSDSHNHAPTALAERVVAVGKLLQRCRRHLLQDIGRQTVQTARRIEIAAGRVLLCQILSMQHNSESATS
jgi:hypothetical protein